TGPKARLPRSRLQCAATAPGADMLAAHRQARPSSVSAVTPQDGAEHAPRVACGPSAGCRRSLQHEQCNASAPAACRGVVALEQPDGRAAARDGPDRPGSGSIAPLAQPPVQPDETPTAFRAVAARE